MKIKNKKNKTNYLNFRDGGVPRKVMIPAGKTADIPGLTDVSKIINLGDLKRGFFEVVTEETKKAESPAPSKKKASKKKKTSKKKEKTEDAFDKVEKEVKDYTDNENKNKN